MKIVSEYANTESPFAASFQLSQIKKFISSFQSYYFQKSSTTSKKESLLDGHDINSIEEEGIKLPSSCLEEDSFTSWNNSASQNENNIKELLSLSHQNTHDQNIIQSHTKDNENTENEVNNTSMNADTKNNQVRTNAPVNSHKQTDNSQKQDPSDQDMKMTQSDEMIENDEDDDHSASEESSEDDSSCSSEDTEGSSFESESGMSFPWIKWYCKLPGHDFLVEVPETFIEDDFNLTGLEEEVSIYPEALDIILDYELDESIPQSKIKIIESQAEILYGLIHQRYILTRQGMTQMFAKYQSHAFGTCPRVLCQGSPVLPIGLSDEKDVFRMKVFCPSCLDVYSPKNKQASLLDGVCIGTTFPHSFMVTFYDQIVAQSPTLNHRHEPGPTYNIYEPAIYGFKIHETAANGPKMQWLRYRKSLLDSESKEYFWKKITGFPYPSTSTTKNNQNEDIDEMDENSLIESVTEN